MIVLKNIEKHFPAFRLNALNLSVEKGDYLVILGASGSGKTLLLETIAGLVKPDSGSVFIDSEDITQKAIEKRNVGLVYQDRALFPHMSVRENIAYGLKKTGISTDLINQRVQEIAKSVGIQDLLERGVEHLSGGESQRTAIARTLAVKPKCLLLDEPLASLDVPLKASVRSLLRNINRDGLTIIHVTHDYEEAISLATKVAIMENGRIIQSGEPEEIFNSPKSEFAASFVGIRNFYNGYYSLIIKDGQAIGVFKKDNVEIFCTEEIPDGNAYLTFRREDVTLSLEPLNDSALNSFEGEVIDVAGDRHGMEVTIDIGVIIHSLITKTSFKKLNIISGKRICLSFKSSAVRVISHN